MSPTGYEQTIKTFMEQQDCNAATKELFDRTLQFTKELDHLGVAYELNHDDYNGTITLVVHCSESAR